MRRVPLIALSGLAAAILLVALFLPAAWRTSTTHEPAAGAPSPPGTAAPPALPAPSASAPLGKLASKASPPAGGTGSTSAPARPDGARLPQESLANLVQRAAAQQDAVLAVAALKAASLCPYSEQILTAMDRTMATTPGQTQLMASRQALDRQVRDCQSLSLAEAHQLPALGHLALRARADGMGELIPGLFKPEQLDADERIAARELMQRALQQCKLTLLDPLLSWKELALPPQDLERYRQARLLHVEPYETRVQVKGQDGTMTTLAADNAQRLQALAAQTAGLSPAQREQALREAQALLKRCEEDAGQPPG